MTAVHFDRDGRARCGNRGWLRLTSDEDAVECRTCLNLLDGTHHVGVRPYDVEPCGTPAAYRRHLRHEGKPVRCLSCLQAEARRNRDDINGRRREQYAAARAEGLSVREANLRRDLRRAA